MTVREWEEHEAIRIMNRLLETHIWVYSSNMTPEEKAAHPKHETTDGYLKAKTLHESWADMWGNLSAANKKVFTTLPNFDKAKLKEITGIDV